MSEKATSQPTILHAWRLVKEKHAAAAFSGEGAKQYGGRWNSPGTGVVYAAAGASLAMLELLVHLQSQEVLKNYVLIEVTFDAGLVMVLDAKQLPKGWQGSPPSAATQRLGDAWALGAVSAVLRVPSAVVAIESNYVFNPVHPDFGKIVIGEATAIRFDPRLVKTRAS